MINAKSFRSIDELWLTAIPKHWDCIKIKYAFSERVEKGYPDEPLLVASQNMGVVPKGVYGNRTVEATKDLHNLKLVRIGDFVISLRSFQGGLEYAYYQGIISPAYTIMIPNANIVSGYFRYLAKSRLFIELLQMCVTGIREGQNIDYERLKNHLIPLPPRNEQDQIVRFLDWKVSKIDKLINAKKKQIELLREYKLAVVNEAVTNGNEKWKSRKISELFLERREIVSDRDFQPLSVSRGGTVLQLDDAVKTISGGDNRKLVRKGDFAINSRSDRKGSSGLSRLNGSVSLINIVITPREDIFGEYCDYALKSHTFVEEFYRFGRGIVSDLWTTRYTEMKSMYINIPPVA
ncbi:MAG: restriction endonuclease subunit S, partial [Chitinispirillales bacterium]|nr:restriction endonuclease subunit S [Chitinispirillales bacterium]